MYLKHTDLYKYWVVDIEADDLNATQIHCIVAENAATDEVREFYGFGMYTDFRNFASDQSTIFVGHNFLSYDGPTLNRLAGTSINPNRIVDTLVLSYLYHPQMPGGHSLEAYGERQGERKILFNDFSRFSTELLERCRQDVKINKRLFLRLTSKMRSVGFSELSCEIEHKIRHIIDKQQKHGFYFDVQKAMGTRARMDVERTSLAEPIKTLFPPELVEVNRYPYRKLKDGSDTHHYKRHVSQYPRVLHNPDGTYSVFDYEEFNIGSPQQRLRKLLSLGFVPTKLTKGGNPSVDEESLVEFAKESGIAEAGLIAEWMVVNSRISMVDTWLDSVSPSDHRIHGRVFSCGAASRRMTHNSPNTANIPSNEAKYGEDCRSLWTAGPGRLLVGTDAKSAQMRCFAHLLPDPSLGARFYDGSEDPHQTNADLIGIKRKPIKNVFYANMFGAFPPKLAVTAGFTGTKKELNAKGEWIQAELYRVTPGLREITEGAKAEFRQTSEGWLRCIDGGYVRCPSEHAALNYKIQPLEAVLMKTGAILLSEYAKDFDYNKVGDIHDEWQNEVNPKEAEEFGRLAVKAIQDAGEQLGFRVPMDGDFKVGKNWAETH